MNSLRLLNFANMKHKLSPYTIEVYQKLTQQLSAQKILMPSYFVEEYTYLHKQAIRYQISNEIFLKSRKI